MRTTNSLEGYHSLLGKKLVSKGNFCKFLDCILDEDLKASAELHNSLDGTYGVFQRPRHIHKKRNELIEKAMNNLKTRKINVEDFLKQMSNWQNDLITLDVIDEPNHEGGSTEEDEDEEDNDSNELTPSQNELICGICFSNPRDVLLIPCNHFKFCSSCYASHSEESKQKGNTDILCPYCRQIVVNSIKVFT